MPAIAWIVLSGIGMNALAMVGALTLVLEERTLKAITLPLVAFSAGTLMGGALFHMLPAAIDALGNEPKVYLWLAGGFLLFFVLEQFLHWHHCHRTTHQHIRPITYLLLAADALHNLIGGLAIGGAFVADTRLGLAALAAAAAHEIPQELGDFGVLVHGGWSRAKALWANVLTGSTFLVGGIIAWAAARHVDTAVLLPFAAGNFIYIAAADLVPEINKHPSARMSAIHFSAFAGGLLALLFLQMVLADH